MSGKATWRLTLADDHPVILRGLRQLIEADERLSVVATATDGFSAETDIRRLRPDVAVLDVHMPVKNGVEILHALTRDRLPTRVVLLTASLSDDMLRDAMQFGARGIVLKDAAPEVLTECVLTVVRGGRWIDPALEARVGALPPASGRQRPTEGLTRREAEIVAMVAAGHANKSIADRMAISEGTVKIHLHNIYKKLGVANRTQLAAISLGGRLNG